MWFWTWIIAPDYARADFGSLKTSATVSAVDLRSFMRGWGSRIANCQIFNTTLPKGRLSTSWRRASAASSNGNLFATMGGDRVFRPLRSRQLHDCVPDRTSDRRRFDPGQRRGTARLESNFNLWRTGRCRRRHLPPGNRCTYQYNAVYDDIPSYVLTIFRPMLENMTDNRKLPGEEGQVPRMSRCNASASKKAGRETI